MLFAEDEKDSIYTSLRKDCKEHGVDGSNCAAMHKYFSNKVDKNLHVELCLLQVHGRGVPRARPQVSGAHQLRL